jgi:DNA-binding transcriptional MocR family regulator
MTEPGPRHWRTCRIRTTFAANIDQMTRGIGKSFPTGTRVSRPAGSFVLWVQLPEATDTRALVDKAVTRGVCFVPGDVFSAGGVIGTTCVSAVVGGSKTD